MTLLIEIKGAYPLYLQLISFVRSLGVALLQDSLAALIDIFKIYLQEKFEAEPFLTQC